MKILDIHYHSKLHCFILYNGTERYHVYEISRLNGLYLLLANSTLHSCQTLEYIELEYTDETD